MVVTVQNGSIAWSHTNQWNACKRSTEPYNKSSHSCNILRTVQQYKSLISGRFNRSYQFIRMYSRIAVIADAQSSSQNVDRRWTRTVNNFSKTYVQRLRWL